MHWDRSRETCSAEPGWGKGDGAVGGEHEAGGKAQKLAVLPSRLQN